MSTVCQYVSMSVCQYVKMSGYWYTAILYTDRILLYCYTVYRQDTGILLYCIQTAKELALVFTNIDFFHMSKWQQSRIPFRLVHNQGMDSQ